MNQQDLKTEPVTTISVVAISYNEEVDLPGFLENLLPWVDEIVIVDDGSTDQTVSVATAAGAKVIHHKMTEEGGFAEQRNQGIVAASCDWILNMDIDERVPPSLASEIKHSIQQTQYHAFRYHRLNFFLHRPMQHGGWNSWNNPQLAKNGFHQYVNRIHERCVVEGEPTSIGQLHSCMWHLNDDGYDERMRKSFQYSKLEADKLIESDIRVTWFHLTFRPCMEFVKKYFLKRGCTDGMPGVIAAMHSASAIFRQYALAWDEQNKISRITLEERLKKEWDQYENSEETR